MAGVAGIDIAGLAGAGVARGRGTAPKPCAMGSKEVAGAGMLPVS